MSYATNNTTARNCVNTLAVLASLLELPVAKATIKDSLAAHPHFPSLLSVSDVLTDWKVRNLSLRIAKSRLQEMPLPLLVIINDGHAERFTVVRSVTEQTVTFSDPQGKRNWVTAERSEFEKQWTGVVLLTDSSQTVAKVSDPLWKRNKFARALSVLLLIAWLTFVSSGLLNQTGAIFPVLLLTYAMAGTVVCVLLLNQELNWFQSSLNKVCTVGKKMNCNAVLRSRAATPGGFVSWSEIGFAYFTGSALALTCYGDSSAVQTGIAWLTVASLLYIPYSVFYQWRIAKQWCVLCLAVQVLLVAGFIISFSGNYLQVNPFEILSVGLAAKMFFLFLLPLAGWLWVKPFLVQAADGNKNKISLNKVKYNSEIFQALLASQKPLADTKGLGISIGNPEGRIRIVKVCNPYCAPCARTHQQIDELLENNKEVEVRIIFFVSPDERDFRNKPVRHLLAIADQGDPQFTHEALNDWYSSSTKDYNAFSKKYRLNEELPRQDQRISDMEAWCRQASISHTPTVFVNGYQLPELYNAEDIRYLFLDNNQTNNTPVNKMKDLSVQ